jgi:hypothetical protein
MMRLIVNIVLIVLFPCYGYAQQVTPALQLQGNIPSSLRQGDHFEFTTTLTNNSDSELTGQVQLQLIDAISNEPVDGWFQNVFPNQYFTVAGGKTETVKFPIEVPYQFISLLSWKLTASYGLWKKESEGQLPVFSNQFFTVEHQPFNERTKDLSLKNLAASGNSETLLNKSLRVEIYNNTAWPLLRLLPVLASSKDEPLDYFNRWCAYNYAAHLMKIFPEIKNSITTSHDGWDKKEETFNQLTPWIPYTGNENWQKERINDFFDSIHLDAGLKKSLQQFADVQLPDGSFPWMKGGSSDGMVTSYILLQLNKLKQAAIIEEGEQTTVELMIDKATVYLNRKKQTPKNPGINFPSVLNDSCYHLLSTVTETARPLPVMLIKAGETVIDLKKDLLYSKGFAAKTFDGAFVNPGMSKISIEKNNSEHFNGNVDWAYFTDLKSSSSRLPWQVTEKMFVERTINKKHILLPVTANTALHDGDRVKIMINLHLSSPVKYFFVKDVFPSAFEQTSQAMFVTRNNFSWYEKKLPGERSYFFPSLPAGEHSFSYWIKVSYAGSFPGGMTTAGMVTDPPKFIYQKGPDIHVE